MPTATAAAVAEQINQGMEAGGGPEPPPPSITGPAEGRRELCGRKPPAWRRRRQENERLVRYGERGGINK